MRTRAGIQRQTYGARHQQAGRERRPVLAPVHQLDGGHGKTVAGGGEAAGASLTVSVSALGDIVTDADGRSLYVFFADVQGEPSTCYDQCEANWPPLTAAVQAGDGIDSSLLGTLDRTDGTAQVSYDRWPLYYFAGDDAPGDTNGQGVGDVWYLINPSGTPLS